MRHEKPWLVLTAAVLLVMVLVSHAYALKPTSAFYVNDYAGVLSSGVSESLVQKGRQLYLENGAQVVVVVVDNYIGESMAAYANQVFNEFGIGTKGKNTGVLLIVAVDDGEVRIEVGDGLSGLIPDSKAGRILDETFMPRAAADDLEGAIQATYLALIREASRLGTSGPSLPVVSVNPWGILFALLLILVGVWILVAAARRASGPRKPNNRPRYGPPGGPYSGPSQGSGQGPGQGRSGPSGPSGGPVFIPRVPVGPPVRYPRPTSTWSNQPRTGGGSSSPSPGRSTPPPAKSPTPPGYGGGGRSSGGGVGRGFNPGGFGGSSGGGGFGGGVPRSGGGWSGGGGRSAGGGAGRGFKK